MQFGQPEVREVKVNTGKHIHGVFLNDEYVYHYIEAGQWEFRMCNRLYRVGPGSIILLYPRLLHRVRPLSSGRLVQQVIHFRMPEEESGANLTSPEQPGLPPTVSLSPSCRGPISLLVPPRARPLVRKVFYDMLEEYLGNKPARSVALAGLMTELLGLYLRHGDKMVAGKEHPAACWVNLQRCIAYIHKNYANANLGIADMSRAAGFSLYHFCRIFRQQLGLSPYQYLTHYRIDQARRLLHEHRLNCSQIAEATGFSSLHRFSKVFKRIEGVAPLFWQRKQQVL